MEFSKTLHDLPPQFFASLVQKVQGALAEGRDVINLGQGNPDQPTPAHIVESLQQSVLNPTTHKYSPFRGLTSLKEAAAAFYKREYNVDLDAEKEVCVLFGGKSGLVEIPLCLLNEGDKILVPDPGYPDYLSGISIAKAIPIMMPLVVENDYLVDYSTLSENDLEQAKLLFLNYPNNPTGATATKEFFEETIQVAKRNNIPVVHDFAYGAIGFDGEKPRSFLQQDGAKDVGIEIYTLSKTYNMAGWRIAFAVGNAKMIEVLNLLQDHLYVSVFPAIQEAAITALTSEQTCVTNLVGMYESRRNTFMKACKEIGWNVTVPKGSFFAWLPVPKGYTSQEFSDYLLDHANVAVAPGVGFGTYGDGYVRVGLLTSEDRLLEAVQRIKALNIFVDSNLTI